MSKTFAIIGAGMQGTAAAYDLATFASPAKILMADREMEQARRSAERVNRLVGREIAEAHQLDALDANSTTVFLQPVDVLISAVPYWMHPYIAPSAIAAKTQMCDLGGDTVDTLKTLDLDPEARSAGVALVPDCGLAPGLVNNIGLHFLENLDECESVKLYCGVLPQHPVPPLNYKLTFNVEGLVAEYEDEAVVLRDGQPLALDTLEELETVEVPGIGTMEAFTTSGGTSTAPYTLQGKVRDYEYKTLRHPGHCAFIKLFREFGFWSREEIEVKGGRVRPVDVFCKVFGDALANFQDRDLCAVKGVGIGTRGGKRIRMTVDILDHEDEATGFTSMERLTGFSVAIIAARLAEGKIPAGGVRYENAMGGDEFLAEIAKRDKVKIAYHEEEI